MRTNYIRPSYRQLTDIEREARGTFAGSAKVAPDYVFFFTRTGSNTEDWRSSGAMEGTFVVQTPIANSDLVVHLEVSVTGVVTIMTRKKLFTGWDVAPKIVYDVEEQVRLHQLAGGGKSNVNF